MDDRVIDVTEKTVTNALKTCDANHNKAFLKGALYSALKTLLLSIMENSSEIKESFEKPIVQAATATKMLATITAAITKNAAMMARIAKFVAGTVKEVERLGNDLILTPPSPPPPGFDSSLNESQNDRKDKPEKKKSYRRKKSSLTSQVGTWSMKGSLNDS